MTSMEGTPAPRAHVDDGELVELVIPADVRFLSAARVVAASLAADHGFDLDDLDRVRLGVDELLTILIEAYGSAERVRLCFGTSTADGRGRVEVSGNVLEAGAPLDEPRVDPLAEKILDAVSDRYLLHTTGFELTVAVR